VATRPFGNPGNEAGGGDTKGALRRGLIVNEESRSELGVSGRGNQAVSTKHRTGGFRCHWP